MNESNMTKILRHGSGWTKNVDGQTEWTDAGKTISHQLCRGIIIYTEFLHKCSCFIEFIRQLRKINTMPGLQSIL